MEFRNLHTFLRVAEIGNFTKAAEELGYAQSTVTTQIQQLESELGISLFDRIGKKAMLTMYGQQLIVYANRILQNVEEIQQFGRTSPADIQGSIRIGIVESLLTTLLLVIERFRNQYPKVFIQVRLGVTEDLLNMLRHNEVDLVYTMGDMWDTKDCECAASHKECAVFFCALNNPLSHKKSIRLNEILDQPLILTGPKTFLYRQLNRLALEAGKTIAPSIQTDSAKVIIDMVERDMGVSLLPEYMVLRPPISRYYQFSILPVENFPLEFYTRIFYHKNKWQTVQMSSFIDFTKQHWHHFD